MHKIYFYRNINGKEPVGEYIDSLAAKSEKDSRIKLTKIREYLKILEAKGKGAGLPYIKQIRGEIWELRPLSDRILFAAWVDNSIILLHHFRKSTNKTPIREIEQAERNLNDLKKRSIK
jgi:phage-related protein